MSSFFCSMNFVVRNWRKNSSHSLLPPPTAPAVNFLAEHVLRRQIRFALQMYILWHRKFKINKAQRVIVQSRQSAKLFLQSSELGLPHPLTRRRVCPPLWTGGGGVHTHACGRGSGGVPIPTRGPTLWYSRYICTL